MFDSTTEAELHVCKHDDQSTPNTSLRVQLLANRQQQKMLQLVLWWRHLCVSLKRCVHSEHQQRQAHSVLRSRTLITVLDPIWIFINLLEGRKWLSGLLS